MEYSRRSDTPICPTPLKMIEAGENGEGHLAVRTSNRLTAGRDQTMRLGHGFNTCLCLGPPEFNCRLFFRHVT